ncbi:GMC oxidoreductase [Prosthecomicrobium pneumaticum]|uniref:Choline dehydrogenase-like flavoprotein n=1 Tax=Prosthecomicrobium pneumaticum TaxID=81895 RepID=A0A7W9FM93_9HYPH|nr:GMC family oxidoreductase [Prosthecomicrobium pneumaticum]MBB5753280.1 choline dehydrogenase-like flavoprotein [Prosthecomicrobium pneumaticum]
MQSSPDIVIIGSGMGGASLAAGLAGSGARITILEKGRQLPDTPECRDPRAIFQRGHFRPKEVWYDAADGSAFNPGNYYYVGGNSKFYGAVLIRYRAEDFEVLEHRDGVSPAWPYRYAELEPHYTRAERLYRVRGSLGQDPTEPRHSAGYPFPAVRDELAIAEVRARLKVEGLHPSDLPLGVDAEAWLKRAKTPWDAFPDSRSGKMDAETCGLDTALRDPNVTLETEAEVLRLVAGSDGRIARIVYRHRGEEKTLSPKIVVLSAGAVKSAALLLASKDERHPTGLANRSDVVGRYFMNHNTTAVIAIDPLFRNTAIHQKTFGFNDFYFSDGAGGPPLGNVQLLGRVSGAILKAQIRWAPTLALDMMASRAVDFLAMSEDLPDAESRVRVDGDKVVLQWKRSNMAAHDRLVAVMKEKFRAAGFPIVVSKPFDRRTPSHQCGTVRFGTDPSASALDPYCRAHDHANLFVVDASFMPSSAAVNPALTIAAQALRTADHMIATGFAA